MSIKTHESPPFPFILAVARNMRADDHREIAAARWRFVRDEFAQEVASAMVTWGVSIDDQPTAVVCACQAFPGMWEVMLFATDGFPRVLKEVTRLVRNEIVPAFFAVGGRRAESLSASWRRSDKLMLSFGARKEGIRAAFGVDGSDYIQWAWLREYMNV